MLRDDYYLEPTETDRLVFEKLIPGTHFLRRAKEIIDFEAFRDLVKEYYRDGVGRPAEDPVRMIKLGFLQHHYKLSDREVLAEAQVNVAFRFFLDLGLDSPLPSNALLSQFRSRLGEKGYRALFEEIVGQAFERGLVKRRLRIKDATHIIANIAVPSAIRLVAESRGMLLDTAEKFEPERVEKERAEAERVRISTSDLSDQERLLHRVDHLQEIVDWADELQIQLEKSSQKGRARERFDLALLVAHKILDDRSKPKGGDRIRSVQDPDARTGKHGSFFDGYLLDVMIDADSEILTALQTLPANANEAAAATSLLAQEHRVSGEMPEALSIDGIAWQGAVLRDIQAMGVTPYVPPRPRPSDAQSYTPDDFHLLESGTELLCPAGQRASRIGRNQRDSGWVYRFSRKLCDACPLQQNCMNPLPKRHGRTVIKNDYQAEYDEMWERSKTAKFDEVRSLHPRVERKLAEVVVRHQGRRTRYRGASRVAIQYLMTGMVINVKRIVKLTEACFAENGQSVFQCPPFSLFRPNSAGLGIFLSPCWNLSATSA